MGGYWLAIHTLMLKGRVSLYSLLLFQTARPADDWDDKMPRISWRGDGQFFVVSAIHPRTGM